MADEGEFLTTLTPDQAANGADTLPAAGIIMQYVRDLSVENPKAPDSFQWQGQPELDVQFNIAARGVSEEVHECELKVSATARLPQHGTVYIVELSYCGLIGLRNMGEDQKHAFVFAEAPRLLFPFARRIVADATRDAGFAPLMLDPIDFQGMYIQQLQQRQAEQAAGEPAGQA
jgi:preprotein translocase subunit SecB